MLLWWGRYLTCGQPYWQLALGFGYDPVTSYRRSIQASLCLSCLCRPAADCSLPRCACCAVQEAGMLAVRKNRYVILAKDFEKAYKNVVRKSSDTFSFYQ